MKRNWTLVSLLLFACGGFATWALVGNRAKGVAVSGTVTQAGQPVHEARILFKPQKGTAGPVGSGRISNGRYHIPAKDGLQAGRYDLEVSLTEVPRRKDLIDEGSRSLQKQEPTLKFQRDVAGENAQIDLEL
jgi:hypothetical protein